MKMKKIICVFIIIGLSTFKILANNDTTPIDVNIVKNTGSTGGFRAPVLNPVSFHGVIYMNELTITAQNYTDNIEVIITGPATIDETVLIDNSGSATLDISSLPDGYYTITVITVGKGTFTGEFTLPSNP